MTPEEQKELASRLRELSYNSLPDEWSIGDVADLDAAADLIEQMAQRVPLSDYEALILLQGLDPSITTVYPGYLAIIRATERHHGIRSEK